MLGRLFEHLTSTGCRLAVITKGYVGVARYILQDAGLLHHFGREDVDVFGRLDAHYGATEYDEAHAGDPAFRVEGNEASAYSGKAALITQLCRRYGMLAADDALLVDDDPGEIERVKRSGCALTWHVSERRGLTPEDAEQITSRC